MIEWMPLTRDYNPYFILGSNIFFYLAVIHLFDITYLAKWLFHSETPFKMLKLRDGVKKTKTSY